MTTRMLTAGALLSVALLTCAPLLTAAETKDGPKPAATPVDTTRYTLVLDDAGLLTGVILSKTPAKWVIKTDDGTTLEVARARIRQARLAPPREEGDKPHGDRPQGDKPPADKPPADKPQGDKPEGNKPQGDKPQGDRPPAGGGDKPQPKLEAPADRGPHPHVTLHLKDGRTLSGTVEKRTDKGAVIKTDKGEIVEVHQDQVKSIE